MYRKDPEFNITACGKLDSVPFKDELRPFSLKDIVAERNWRTARPDESPGPSYTELLQVGAKRNDHVIAGLTIKDDVVLVDCGPVEVFRLLRYKMSNAYQRNNSMAEVQWFLLDGVKLAEARVSLAKTWTQISLPPIPADESASLADVQNAS